MIGGWSLCLTGKPLVATLTAAGDSSPASGEAEQREAVRFRSIRKRQELRRVYRKTKIGLTLQT